MHDFSLSVRAGEAVALTGRNGCRTWALADVIVRDTSQGPTTYRWKKIMLLNNMVRFR